MKNTTHRVVILKNVNSDMISQAILILKDSAVESDTKLMLEAEKIVEKYMNKSTDCSNVKNSTRATAWILSAGVLAVSAGVLALLKLI